MPRAAWNGAISFGLVQIPVELYPGDESHELSFTWLDKRDLSPVGTQRINKKTGEIVPYDQIVKGYEYAKQEYVVLSPADFLRANVEATRTIDIQDFVPFDALPPTFYDRPYYVKPKKLGAKAYAVLQAALHESGRAGIATVVLHTRQHLAALIASGPYLVLELLRFSDEIRSAEETVGTFDKIPSVTRQEQTMAEQLIEGMSGPWDPRKYHDVYREDLLRLINEKVASGEVNRLSEEEEVPQPRPQREGVVDLVALLRQSLQARRPAKPSSGPSPASLRSATSPRYARRGVKRTA
jgi:DNA end-binding protein Ku